MHVHTTGACLLADTAATVVYMAVQYMLCRTYSELLQLYLALYIFSIYLYYRSISVAYCYLSSHVLRYYNWPTKRKIREKDAYESYKFTSSRQRKKREVERDRQSFN